GPCEGLPPRGPVAATERLLGEAGCGQTGPHAAVTTACAWHVRSHRARPESMGLGPASGRPHDAGTAGAQLRGNARRTRHATARENRHDSTDARSANRASPRCEAPRIRRAAAHPATHDT